MNLNILFDLMDANNELVDDGDWKWRSKYEKKYKEKNRSLGLVNWTLWKRTKMKQETHLNNR